MSVPKLSKTRFHLGMLGLDVPVNFNFNFNRFFFHRYVTCSIFYGIIFNQLKPYIGMRIVHIYQGFREQVTQKNSIEPSFFCTFSFMLIAKHASLRQKKNGHI